MAGRLEHPNGCGCAVCVHRRDELRRFPREREVEAHNGPDVEPDPVVQPAGDRAAPAAAVAGEDGVDGIDGEPGRDGQDGRDGETRHTVEHQHHHHGQEPSRGRWSRRRADRRYAKRRHRHGSSLFTKLLILALVLWGFHTAYGDIPGVPGIACQSSTGSAGGVQAAGLSTEQTGLGSTLGGLAEDTVGAAVKKIALAAAEGVLHAAGDTLRSMLSGPPSTKQVYDGLNHDAHTAGRVVGFVTGGVAGDPVAQEALPAPVVPTPCGQCPTTAVPATSVAGTPAEVAARAVLRAGSDWDPVLMTSIAGAESTWRPGVQNSIGAQGLFQMLHHGDLFDGPWSDPYANARAAHRLWKQYGLSPWVSSRAHWGDYRARAAAAVAAVRTPTRSHVVAVSAPAPTVKLAGLKPVAQRAADYVRTAFGFKGSIGGFATSGHISNSKHYQGLAIDIMIPRGALATRITNYFAGPGYRPFHVDNVIHDHRIYNSGRGWHAYPDRGNPTLNHEDHVHVDFLNVAPSSGPAPAPSTSAVTPVAADCVPGAAGGGVAAASAGPSAGGFNVGSLNVQGASHRGGAGLRMARAVSLLGDGRGGHSVDVVGLQELQSGQARTFDALTGSTWARFSSPHNTENSIAWRRASFTLIQGRTIDVPYFYGKTKPMTYVLLQTPAGGRVYVLNVHNASSSTSRGNMDRYRHEAVAAEVSLLQRLQATGIPVIMTGDMNAHSEGAAFARALGAARMHQAAPKYHDDWILGSPGLRFTGHVSDRGAVDRAATDHPIVVARVGDPQPAKVTRVKTRAVAATTRSGGGGHAAAAVARPAPAPRGGSVAGTAAAVNAAAAHATPGTVIRLADGRYDGLEVTSSCTAARPCSIVGGRGAVVSGSNYDVHLQGADYWQLRGFTVRGGNKGVVLDGSSHNVIDGLDVGATGDEGIHLRYGSAWNTVSRNTVHNTGQSQPGYGEGIYVGSAVSNWQGGPDRSDHNGVIENRVGHTGAENVDIKEGTTGGVLRGNRFDGTGMSGQNFADSWVDIKGNGWIASGNVGVAQPSGGGITVHQLPKAPGWGLGNLVS
jgi:parallel beta-helix repeat protein